MTVSVYQSSDVGAPQLTNASGSLIAILDACLVNGYGSKAGAGWTKPYASSNLIGGYQQGAGSNGFICQVDDSAGTVARIRGFETMSAINVGAGQFPYDIQLSGGAYMIKHDGGSGNGYVRGWTIIATEKAFYFQTQFDTTLSWGNAALTFFGDLQPLRTNDQYDTFLMGATSATPLGVAYATATASTSYPYAAGLITPINYTQNGHYLARNWSGFGSSVGAGKHADISRLVAAANNPGAYSYSNSQQARIGADGWTVYPNPSDGGLFLTPIYVHEPNNVRGVLPGAWMHSHISFPFAQGNTVAGSGELAGRVFMALTHWNSVYMVEISDTW